MDQTNPNALISMVNRKGRVVWVHRWEVDNQKEQGSRVIINPKQEYYPNLDEDLNPHVNEETISENVDPTALLKVTEL